MHQAQMLGHRLDALVRDQATKVTGNAAESTGAYARENAGKVSTATVRHAELISAAVSAATHPLGNSNALITVLRNPPPGLPAPTYQPLLVLLLAELTLADAIVTPSDHGGGHRS